MSSPPKKVVSLNIRAFRLDLDDLEEERPDSPASPILVAPADTTGAVVDGPPPSPQPTVNPIPNDAKDDVSHKKYLENAEENFAIIRDLLTATEIGLVAHKNLLDTGLAVAGNFPMEEQRALLNELEKLQKQTKEVVDNFSTAFYRFQLIRMKRKAMTGSGSSSSSKNGSQPQEKGKEEDKQDK